MVKKRRAEQADSGGEESQYESSTNDGEDLAISSGYESSVAEGSGGEDAEFPIDAINYAIYRDSRKRGDKGKEGWLGWHYNVSWAKWLKSKSDTEEPADHFEEGTLLKEFWETFKPHSKRRGVDRIPDGRLGQTHFPTKVLLTQWFKSCDPPRDLKAYYRRKQRAQDGEPEVRKADSDYYIAKARQAKRIKRRRSASPVTRSKVKAKPVRTKKRKILSVSPEAEEDNPVTSRDTQLQLPNADQLLLAGSSPSLDQQTHNPTIPSPPIPPIPYLPPSPRNVRQSSVSSGDGLDLLNSDGEVDDVLGDGLRESSASSHAVPPISSTQTDRSETSQGEITQHLAKRDPTSKVQGRLGESHEGRTTVTQKRRDTSETSRIAQEGENRKGKGETEVSKPTGVKQSKSNSTTSQSGIKSDRQTRTSNLQKMKFKRKTPPSDVIEIVDTISNHSGHSERFGSPQSGIFDSLPNPQSESHRPPLTSHNLAAPSRDPRRQAPQPPKITPANAEAGPSQPLLANPPAHGSVFTSRPKYQQGKKIMAMEAIVDPEVGRSRRGRRATPTGEMHAPRAALAFLGGSGPADNSAHTVLPSDQNHSSSSNLSFPLPYLPPPARSISPIKRNVGKRLSLEPRNAAEPVFVRQHHEKSHPPTPPPDSLFARDSTRSPTKHGSEAYLDHPYPTPCSPPRSSQSPERQQTKVIPPAGIEPRPRSLGKSASVDSRRPRHDVIGSRQISIPVGAGGYHASLIVRFLRGEPVEGSHATGVSLTDWIMRPQHKNVVFERLDAICLTSHLKKGSTVLEWGEVVSGDEKSRDMFTNLKDDLSSSCLPKICATYFEMPLPSTATVSQHYALVLLSTSNVDLSAMGMGQALPAGDLIALLICLPLDGVSNGVLPDPITGVQQPVVNLLADPLPLLTAYGVTPYLAQYAGKNVRYCPDGPERHSDIMEAVREGFQNAKAKSFSGPADLLVAENTWLAIAKIPKTKSGTLPSNMKVLAVGPSLSLLPHQWQARPLWEFGGLVTFSSTLILQHPKMFQDIMDGINLYRDKRIGDTHRGWAAYLAPPAVEFIDDSWPLLSNTFAKQTAFDTLTKVLFGTGSIWSAKSELAVSLAPPSPHEEEQCRDWQTWRSIVLTRRDMSQLYADCKGIRPGHYSQISGGDTEEPPLDLEIVQKYQVEDLIAMRFVPGMPYRRHIYIGEPKPAEGKGLLDPYFNEETKARMARSGVEFKHANDFNIFQINQ